MPIAQSGKTKPGKVERVPEPAIVKGLRNAYNWPRQGRGPVIDATWRHRVGTPIDFHGVTREMNPDSETPSGSLSTWPHPGSAGIDPTQVPSGVGSCCSLTAIGARTLFCVAIVATGLAGYAFGVMSLRTQPNSVSHAAWQIPGTIEASSAVSSEKYSIATGMVGDEADGIFVLDHNSGLLQCHVIYPRMSQFMATFSVNVADGLGTGAKGGNYLMVTGRAEFPRASNRPIGANTLVYVLNNATGNFIAYAVPFDRTAVNAGRPQKGVLIPMGAGQANPVIDRDAAR